MHHLLIRSTFRSHRHQNTNYNEKLVVSSDGKTGLLLLNQSICCTHQRILGFWISLDFELVMQSLCSPFVDLWTWAPSTPRGAGWFVHFGSGAKLQWTTELWCICSFTAQPHRGERKGQTRYQIISPLGINLIYLSKYSKLYNRNILSGLVFAVSQEVAAGTCQWKT